MKKKGCMYEYEDQDFFEIKDNFEGNRNVSSELMHGKRKGKCEISIMIPTYLRNGYLQEAVNSAVSQKTDISYEVVVVDNNDDFSDTGTLHIMEKYEGDVCYYKNRKNLGMFGNWNRCIELASGNWVLILHDDDIIEETYIDTMMRAVREYPGASAVGCGFCEIDGEGKVLGLARSALHRIYDRFSRNKALKIEIRDMYFAHPINIMGCLLNRKKALEAGGFDDRWYPVSDYVFLLNLVYRWDVHHISKQLFRYRIAVNISYRLDHVIGCLEMDVSMRKSINNKNNIVGKDRDIHFRSALESVMERTTYVRFGARLSSEEKERLQQEFERYREFCGLKPVSGYKRRQFDWFEKWYVFNMSCMRAKRVEF